MEQATVEKLVTARVVGEAMGMATSQVYRLAAQAKIRSFQVGGKKGGVRFDLREVREDLRRPATHEVSK
jgi:hypothetical protein